MDESVEFVVEEEGIRLDRLLCQQFKEQSRSYFQKLIEQGSVQVNGKSVKKREQPKLGDLVQVTFNLNQEIKLEPEDIPLEILYEDQDMIAINKPSGMVVHPAPGHWKHTFVNALLFHCDVKHQEKLRPGIVHRLDKETTGILIAAKNEKMHALLSDLFAKREIEKEYLAICLGVPNQTVVETLIGRDQRDRKKMAVVKEKGRAAKTRLKTLFYNEELSCVHIFLETGRTHQARLHMRYLKTPILGDRLYGSISANQRYAIERQLLHAYKLSFIHPITQEKISLEAPIPADMQKVMDKIQR